jgi:hypothetical protein
MHRRLWLHFLTPQEHDDKVLETVAGCRLPKAMASFFNTTRTWRQGTGNCRWVQTAQVRQVAAATDTQNQCFSTCGPLTPAIRVVHRGLQVRVQ